MVFYQYYFFKFIYKIKFTKIIYMHETVQNLINIQNELKQKLSNDNQIPNIIAVSKTSKLIILII